MAGNHRAPRPAETSRSHRVLMIATGAALVLAIVLGGRLIVVDDPPATGTTPRPTSVASNPATTPPSSTPASTPTSSAAPDLPRVPPSSPRRLTAPGMDVGFDSSIEPRNGRFVAASTAEAARWGSRGAPGSPGTDSVIIVGKVYTQGSSAFSGLQRLEPGDRVGLRTQNDDQLRYSVTRSAVLPAAGILQVPELDERQPGRLVLVGILYDAQDDQRTDSYLVVTAQLDDARRG